MNPFYFIDHKIVCAVEHFCHFTQRTFGIKSHHWAKLCCVLLIVIGIWELLRAPIWIKPFTFLSLLWLGGLYRSSRENPTLRQSDAVANPNKIGPARVIRIIMFWFGASMVVLAHEIIPTAVLYTAYMYFTACDDLPWGKSKLREWIGSLKGSFSSVKEAEGTI